MIIFRPIGCLFRHASRRGNANIKQIEIITKRSNWSNKRGFDKHDIKEIDVELKLSPEAATPAPSNNGRILVPVLFTFGFAGSCYTLSAIWEYENLRKRALKFRQEASGWIKRQMQGPKHGELRNHLNHWWRSQTDEQKLYYAILVANATVFLAWRVPALHSFMYTYFMANPFGRAVCWPMVFSTFSHYSAIHFGLNMYVLHSFMNATAGGMGKEQFLGFYLSAGVFSSLASHVFKTLTWRVNSVSLGASGAIMAVLSYFCCKHEDALLQVAFVPGFTFTASSGLKAILCFDAAGMMMGWKMFDHAAHLGGALFGIFWYYWGQKNLWGERVALVQRWHEFRTKTSD